MPDLWRGTRLQHRLPYLQSVNVQEQPVKIAQTPSFQPITITLETRDEADAFFAMLTQQHGEVHDPADRLRIKLSDWFSNEYQ